MLLCNPYEANVAHSAASCIQSHIGCQALSSDDILQASLLGDMEGAGTLSEALEGGAAFGALQGLMQTWLHAAVMDHNWCALDRKPSHQSSCCSKARLPSPGAPKLTRALDLCTPCQHVSPVKSSVVRRPRCSDPAS